MMSELGLPVTAAAVARHYGDLHRRLCARSCRCGMRGRAWHSGDDSAYADADARGSRPAGARRARRRRSAFGGTACQAARSVLRRGAVQGDRAGQAAPGGGADARRSGRRSRSPCWTTCCRRSRPSTSLRGVLVVTTDPDGAALAAQLRRAGLVRSCPRGPYRRGASAPRTGCSAAGRRPDDDAGRHPAGDAGRHPPAAGRACARQPASRSCRRATISAPTRCCARRPMRCRCASATTASSRISRPRARTASSRDVVRLPRIALDIDTPEDLALFLATPSRRGRARCSIVWACAPTHSRAKERPHELARS